MRIKLILFIILLIFILIFLVVIRLFSPQKINPQSNKTIDTSFSVISSTPTDQMFPIDASLTITFSKTVDESTLQIKTVPETEISSKLDAADTVLTITPTGTWDFNTFYTITINKTTSSKDGVGLGYDKVIEFKTIKYGGI